MANPNWRKGMTSPNPTGARLGRTPRRQDVINDIIDRYCGPGAEKQIEVIALMSRGVFPDPHIPNTFVRVDAKTASICAMWIAEQRHGKARQSVDVDLSGEIGHRTHDLGRLVNGELATLEAILAKAELQALTDSHDAELVSPLPSEGENQPLLPATTEENKGQ